MAVDVMHSAEDVIEQETPSASRAIDPSAGEEWRWRGHGVTDWQAVMVA
jgi:hypothetical protein